MLQYHKNNTAFAERLKANKGQKVISCVHSSLESLLLNEEEFEKWSNDESFESVMVTVGSFVGRPSHIIPKDGFYYMIGQSTNSKGLMGIQTSKTHEIIDL